MKAQVLEEIGKITYKEVENPVPEDGCALVKISACGICGSDIPRIFKTGAHNMPLIPGHEMMGVVEECKTRPDLEGKRVGIFPLLPCKKCSRCRKQHYEMCENYSYLGSRCDGGYAEYVSVPVWNLLLIPDPVDDEDAAMMEPMSVAVHAIRQIGLIDENGRFNACDDSIVVCGLGTIGLLVALFLRDGGCKNVFCIGNKDIQREKLLQMGYDEDRFCDVRKKDPEAWIMDKTGGNGADIYFECIGRSDNYQQAVKCTGPLGKVMLVGNPASQMDLSREVYWKILRNQMTLKGTWNSSFYGNGALQKEGDDWQYALDRVEKWSSCKKNGENVFLPGDLITHRFSLENMKDGLDIMRDKSEEYIKILVEYKK